MCDRASSATSGLNLEDVARDLTAENDKRRRTWAKRASSYDASIGFFERRVFGTSHRAWACSRANGRTLEVAVGTGLNLALYPPSVALTAVDLSIDMLRIAARRARAEGVEVELGQADAHALPFDDGSFDTVVCTYSLCNILDADRAIGEMRRVTRPGGRIILVDHIRSAVRPLLWLQKAIEFVTLRAEGERMTRRPRDNVAAADLDIVERDRLGLGGMVERLVALKTR